MSPADAPSLTPPLPRELQVEVTGACNLRCRMCLVRYRPAIDRVSGSFSADDFYALVEANPRLERLTLQGLGEPLLVPHLDEMIEFSSRRGIAVGFNTNATLLTENRARRLVDAGLDWLHVSLDGATAPTYEAIRDGASFERVCRNVRGLTHVMAQEAVERPRLQIVFVAMRRNIAELPRLVALADDLGVGDVWVQNLSHSFDDTDASGRYVEIRSYARGEALWAGSRTDGDPSHGDWRRWFDEARRVADRLGVRLRLPSVDPPAAARREGTPGCDWPWRSAYVNHDGVVQPCCMLMGSDRAALGSLDEGSFAEIWASQPYQDFRRALMTDAPPDVCRGCSLYHHTF